MNLFNIVFWLDVWVRLLNKQKCRKDFLKKDNLNFQIENDQFVGSKEET